MLTPLSWLYGAVTSVRNFLFDKHIIPQHVFDVPVVCVGNISVGGSGKTPHVEFLLSHLASDYNIAVLSRGYKRKTKGYVMANSKSTPDSIGDEPYQIYQKFGMVAKVAVCEKRVQGIKNLQRDCPDINLIILDDAFQHRYVKPKVSILLTEYEHPFYEDKLLPLGRLRESQNSFHRADIVLFTKCQEKLSPLDYRIAVKALAAMPYQNVFFTQYVYSELRPVFPDDSPYRVSLETFTSRDSVILLTGIANPRYFVRHFKSYGFHKKIIHFPDHHNFTRTDIEKIEKIFESMTGSRKIIITTEKDAVRLSFNPYYPLALKKVTYYQPITVRVLEGLKGDGLIPAVRKSIEDKGNPLSQKYGDDS